MQKVQSKAYKNRLKGHKDGVITLYSPDGPESGIIFSASKDGCLRGWNLVEKKIMMKLFVSRIDNEQINKIKEAEHGDSQQMAMQQDDEEQYQLKQQYIKQMQSQQQGEHFGNQEDDEFHQQQEYYQQDQEDQDEQDEDDDEDDEEEEDEQDDGEEEEEEEARGDDQQYYGQQEEELRDQYGRVIAGGEVNVEKYHMKQQFEMEKFIGGYDRNQDQEQQFSCAVFSDNCLYAGFQDGNIFAWSIIDGQMTQVLQGHIDKVTQLGFLNNRQLISCSLDHTLRIWDTMLGSNEVVIQLPGPVTLMRNTQNYIHMIISKNTFYTLSVANQKIVQSIKFANTIISNFIVHNQTLIIGTLNNQMEIYDLEKINEDDIQPKKIIEGISGWILSMNILGKYLFTGGDDSKIHVWDLEKDFKHSDELNGHRDGVISIEFAGNMLYSGSYDHSVRSWDLQEMYDRIRERGFMMREDLWSKKHDAYYNKIHSRKKKKKKGGKKGGKKSGAAKKKKK